MQPATDVAPAAEFEFPGQFEHIVMPVIAANLPGGQGSHDPPEP